ncbi:MAG TPA: HAD-IA family hydrolase [Kiritimatiellia bacterium]|nr:HAD-IA family hydrolase [Kiritimatiellia bacterium]HRU71346.1 HAD-IA family hydrolase [Kiritimatiellia bacterium]
MKTLLFDLDGTLIDSRADLACAVNLTRQDFGLPPKSVAEVVACVGEGVRVLIERAIPERPDLWEAMLVRQRVHYVEHCLEQTVLYPGVAETLGALKADGWHLAVVTNKPSFVTHPILAGLGIAKYFGAVVGGGDSPTLKPDPAPLRLAAEQMGVTLDADDWMVGDNFTDLAAGRNAGIRRCFCRFGFGEPRDETWDLAIDRFEELRAFLSRQLGGRSGSYGRAGAAGAWGGRGVARPTAGTPKIEGRGV